MRYPATYLSLLVILFPVACFGCIGTIAWKDKGEKAAGRHVLKSGIIPSAWLRNV